MVQKDSITDARLTISKSKRFQSGSVVGLFDLVATDRTINDFLPKDGVGK